MTSEHVPWITLFKPSTAANALQSILGADFSVFNWSELTDKEDPIGRGLEVRLAPLLSLKEAANVTNFFGAPIICQNV